MNMHFIQSGVLAILFFTGLLALLSVPLYQLSRNKLTGLPCQIRSNILAFWLLSPVLISVILTLSGFIPFWMESHETLTAHCSSHNNSIAHLCWFDPIVHFFDLIWASGVSLMAVLVIFNTCKGIGFLIKHRRFQTKLRTISAKEPQRDIFCIASEHFFIFSSGLFTPQAFISSHLLEKLSTEELEVVLAHEQAHCRRRDILQRLFLRFAGLFHLPGTRQHLLSDLELAHEQICDVAAVKKTRDRLLVAKTIIKIARQLNTLIPKQRAGIIAFNGSHIDLRIQQLLEQPKPVNRYAMLFSTLFFILILSGILTLIMPLHPLP